MGLADRQYSPPYSPRGAGGLGFSWRVREWSVTTWLIVLNVAVFLLGATLLARPGVPMLESWRLQATRGPTAELPVYFLSNGAEASSKEVSTPGMRLQRVVIDTQTKTPVGISDYVVRPPLDAYGHFSTQKGFLELQVWRLLTFQFLHANALHLFFNMLGLFMFAPTVERYLGRQRFLAFYLVTGIAGGVLYLLLNLLGYVAQVSGLPALPGLLFHQTTVPLVGASAGVFGVIMACAKIEPDTIVQLILPPVQLRMKVMAYAFVGIAALNLLLSGKNAGGDAAHLGGAIAGFFFIRHSHLLRDFFDVFEDSRKTGQRANQRAGQARRWSWPWSRGSAPASALEVDRILEKVRASGVASLTEAERRALAADTERLRVRQR